MNICSVSGGKDSTALYCLMIEYFGQNFLPIFSDTGHEHPVTVNYVRNLHLMAGGPEVVIVRGDFSKPLEKKGIEPSDNPFLDMMLWKGRAPSTKAQFCTEHLKLWPIKFYLDRNFRDQEWIMFTGIRAGESPSRAKKQPFSTNTFFNCDQVFPLLYASEAEVFAFLDEKGVPPNPLYALGQKRVGCFPCIHARKDELQLLPDWAWSKLIYWEKTLGKNFFAPGTIPTVHIPTVEQVRDWCRTSHGGRQFDIFRQSAPDDVTSCMTEWNICE